MEFITNIANGFIGLFQECGDTFLSNVTGNIPMLVCLFTMIHFITKLVGEKRVNRFAKFMGKNKLLTYGVLPSFAWFFFSSPGALTVGRFLPEKCKPGFEDALGRCVHPLTSIFPHIVPAELWIWMGIASGVTALGLDVMALAVRAIIVGVVMGCLGGFLTERIFLLLAKRDGKNVD